MTDLETLISQIEVGNLDAVEEAWFLESSERPERLDFFIEVAQHLSRAGEEDRAATLLELLDESLRDRGAWPLRLELLRDQGRLYLGKDDLHPALLETLREVHSQAASFDTLVEAVGLNRAPQDIKKNWLKAERLEELLQRDVGTVVAMKGKGVGRVVEANLELGSFKVDFGGRAPLTVGFRAAPKMLQILDEEHVLHRKLSDEETLVALAADDPSELLHAVLRSYEKPLAAGEIREILSGIVADKRWTSFWTAARKHPQVVTHGKGARQTYGWAESSDHALDAVWEAFEAADPRQKIERLRRDRGRDPELTSRMEASLAALGRQVADGDPGLAFEIRIALSDGGTTAEDDGWSRDSLVQGNVARLLESVQSRSAREEVLVQVRKHRSDWLEVLQDILPAEVERTSLDRGYRLLAQDDEGQARAFLEALLRGARQNPAAFTWLAEKARDDEKVASLWPARLAKQLLIALDLSVFQSFRSRLEPLCETGGTLPRLLAHLDEQEASQTLDALGRNRSLPDYVRKPLVTAIELRFPHLGEQEKQQPLYALPASIQARKAELKELLEKEIPTNRKAIEEARALGDLRENFEYKSARARHEYLNQRVATLNGQLERARPLELKDLRADQVRIGTTVSLAGDGGQELRYSILGPWESDPDRQILSYESEMGEQLLGLAEGDELELRGTSYRVISIEPFEP